MVKATHETAATLGVAKMRSVKTFSAEEVRQHNDKDDCWVIVKNKVYNVTKWLKFHPGGEAAILTISGRDCTEVFKAFHSQKALEKKLPAFYIGDLDDADCRDKSALANDLDRLKKKFREEGVFDTNYGFYYKHAVWLASLFALVLYLVFNHSDCKLGVIAAAVTMGIFWQQMAFIGHDLGHHGVTYDPNLDDKIGLFCGNFTTGVSIGWWKASHNMHHIVTNSIEYDPDIQHVPFLAVSKEYFKSTFSFYHKRQLFFGAVAKFFVTKQHYLYYVIMSLARFNLYVQSFIHIIKSRNKVGMFELELLSLFGFWSWFTMLCSCLPTAGDIALFVLISHMVAGIIHVQITLSHFSMPTFKGLPNYEDGYIAWQFYTTLDVDCWPILDWFHGGLQFQVEHHLFPNAGRGKLRSLIPDVKALCEKHNLPYNSMSFLDANVDVIRVLRETAKEAKGFSSLIVDGINAVG